MAVTMERMTQLEKDVQEANDSKVEQDRINKDLMNLLETQSKQLEQQRKHFDEKMSERDRKLAESVREQIAAATEEKKGGFWSRLFGG